MRYPESMNIVPYEYIETGDIVILNASRESSIVGRIINLLMIWYDTVINKDPISISKAHHTGTCVVIGEEIFIDEMLGKGRTITDFRKAYKKYDGHIDILTPKEPYCIYAKIKYEKLISSKRYKKYKYAFAALLLGHLIKALTGVYLWVKNAFRTVCSGLSAKVTNNLNIWSGREQVFLKPNKINPEDIKDNKFFRKKSINWNELWRK